MNLTYIATQKGYLDPMTAAFHVRAVTFYAKNKVLHLKHDRTARELLKHF